MRRAIPSMTVLCFSLLLTVGAQGQQSQKRQPPEKRPKQTAGPTPSYDGTWVGRTGQDRSMYFIVREGQVTVASAEAIFEPVCPEYKEQDVRYGARATAKINQPIGKRSFSFTGAADTNEATLDSVSGSFTSASSATGRLTAAYRPTHPPKTCFEPVETTWTALRIDASQYDGSWTGPWRQISEKIAGKVTFAIVKGEITSIAFEGAAVDFSRGCSATVKTNSSGVVTIIGGTFSSEVPAGPGGTSYEIDGTFDSASKARGSLLVRVHPAPGSPPCSAYWLGGWSAEKEEKGK